MLATADLKKANQDTKSAYRVLIVDDDQGIRNLMRSFLTEQGYSCETASDGNEALEKAGKTYFDAVITDIKMPEMDGITLTRELVKKYPDISIMVMTGFVAEYSEKEVIDAGAHDFITKPFTNSEFFARFLKMISDHHKMDYLKDIAYFDSITGLPNRKLFFDRLNTSIESAKRYHHMLALLFLDLDRFKAVNDSLGHDIGDFLLKEVAQRLTDCVRKSDTVARFGGDEFTIVLAHIDEEREASVIAQRITTSLSMPFQLGGQECSISVSIGISLYPSDGDNTEALLKKADAAMYQAKEQRKNK
ncbi:MAG: GGDEF domain-containing response regulator [Nitrospirae bacterium]|nr:GGDEF domain-containing response regulator [Nitrospirota bacterium]